MLKIASWNVNSLKVRLEQVLSWLNDTDTDILALQETKLTDDNFPEAAIRELGYHVVYSGQKKYNGVAIISRFPIDDVQTDIEGFPDMQRRILAVTIKDLRIVNLYVPNGSEVGSDKYQYKLEWLAKVTAFIKEQLTQYPKLAVVGDFNIAPEDNDVHDPQEWLGSVMLSDAERSAYTTITDLGLTDVFRYKHPKEQAFSWWDYRAASFRRNRGLRIDLILLSASLLEQCVESEIDVEPRKAQRPSDHAPVWGLLSET